MDPGYSGGLSLTIDLNPLHYFALNQLLFFCFSSLKVCLEMDSFKFVLTNKFEKPSIFLENFQKTKKKIMSVPKNTNWLDDIDENFLEFLGEYHEDKWEKNYWYDIDVVIVTNKLVSNNSYDLKVYNTDDTDYSKEELTKFKKYLQYQLQQYAVGKVELVYSYGIYLKLNKKTRNISTQTDVSLDANKKYYGPKVL